MTTYLPRRLLLAAGTVGTAAVLSFLLVHAMPGSPGAVLLGPGADPAAVRARNTQLGWYDPLATQFWRWLVAALHGDLGLSAVDGHGIGPDLMSRLPVTLSVAVLATVASGVLGTVLGSLAAVRGGRLDRVLAVGSGTALSLPPFWVGIVAVYLLSIRLDLLPATGYVPVSESPRGWLASVALPVLTLTVAGAGVVTRTARAAMSEALAQDHLRMLRATGVPRWRLLWVHALRLAAIPVVSVLGMQFIGLFGGSIVIEQLFVLPGLGQATQTAVAGHDFPALQGVVVVATLTVVAVNLVTDLLVMVLDPRVRVT